MNKLFNNITILAKSFYGLIIYFAVAFIFNFILKNYQGLNTFNYNIILMLYEITMLLLLILVFRKRLKKDFIDFDKNYKNYLSIGFKAWLLGLMVMILSNIIINNFILFNTSYNQNANLSVLNRFPLYSVISMIMTGPFIEEMVFRLSFKNALKSKKLYYLLSVLIFTSLHVLNGISNPLELVFFVPYGAMAIAFSYMLDKTDNIFTTVIIHIMHNAFSIVLISIASFL